MVIYIEGKDVRRTLSWDDLIVAMEDALYSFSHSKHPTEGCEQPLRTRMHLPENDGMLMLMPGYMNKSKALAVKMLTIFPKNSGKGISAISGRIMFMDGETGSMLAIIDGETVTELRTAASTAAVTKKFFPEGCHRIAILGAGVQGRSHARVLNHILRPTQVRIWSRTSASSAKLVEILKEEGVPAMQFLTAKEAVDGCDVVSTCTDARSPILMKEWIKPGALINAVGAASPECQEIDPELMRSATVYVDSIESALTESGCVIKSGVTDLIEAGNIIRDSAHRKSSNTTIFKSLGLAVEDVAAAKLVYDAVQKEANQ